MVEVDVRGAQQLVALSRACKQLGAKDLMSEATKAITASVAPLKRTVGDRTDEFLPKRGGLAKRVARTRLAHRTRKTGKQAGVRIVAQPSHATLRDPLRADRGRIKHPVFGMAASRAPWTFQDVDPGWFSTPLEEGAPVVREELLKALEDAADKVRSQVLRAR